MTAHEAEAHLREAVRLANENAAAGRPPFAALVVLGGEVVATGVNTTTDDLDPTAHGEVQAIRAACRARGTLSLDGAVVYSSCEPCPVCHATAILVGARIVYAAGKELAAAHGFVLDRRGLDAQAALRAADPPGVASVPVAGPDDPFATWAARGPRAG